MEVCYQLYTLYSDAKDILALKAVVGEEALTDDDRKYLDFLDKFDNTFLRQGPKECRDVFKTLEMGWDLLRIFPRSLLNKINTKTLDEFYKKKEDEAKKWSK